MNNPLGIIQNYLDLLHLESLNENALDCLDKIQSELTRIVEIISSLLSFSRTGVRPMRQLELHGLLDEVTILMGHKIRNRKIRLRKEFCHPSLMVEGHENKFKQLFINLLSNAVEAVLNEGEIILKTSVQTDQKPDDYVLIEVTDNGHGIPEEIREQVFTPFYSTKMTKTNTGLGLSICQHIVESYDGFLTVQSVPGEYTTFTVRLPR